MPTLLVPAVIEQLLRVGGPEAAAPAPHRMLADVITTIPGQSPGVNPTVPRDEYNCPRVRG
jgi:hypothetical protein